MFLRGPGSVDRSGQPPNPNLGRLSAIQWDLLYAAEQRAEAAPCLLPTSSSGEGGEEDGEEGEWEGEGAYSPLEGLCESVEAKWDEWVSWADGGDVWDASRVPGAFFAGSEGQGVRERGEREGAGRATTFQRLLLVKAFRDDQLLRCIAKFVGEKLGSSFAERYRAVVMLVVVVVAVVMAVKVWLTLHVFEMIAFSTKPLLSWAAILFHASSCGNVLELFRHLVVGAMASGEGKYLSLNP